MKNEVGVYSITNSKSDKTYIGRGVLSQRRYKHFWQLKNNCHPNKHLQRSFNKHGESVFEFSILIYCDNESSIMYEKKLIEKKDNDKLYNMTKGGEDGEISQRALNKISDKMTGRVFSENTIEKMKESGRDPKRDSYNLDKQDVLKIVFMLKDSYMKQSEIGEVFDVGWEAIACINNGINWDWLTGVKEDQQIRGNDHRKEIYARSAQENNKLDSKDVKKIKKLLRKGDLTQIEISNRFNIAPSSVTHIKNEDTWQNITID